MNNKRAIIEMPKMILWIVLSIPAVGMCIGYFSGNVLAGELLHPSGEFSARFMIIAMLSTPLMLLCKRMGWSLRVPLWLTRYRRAFGVAAFGYAALHLVLYLIDIAILSEILAELSLTGIWTGWLAFLIFVPLAITSNNRSQKLLKRTWKKLQRTVYIAAVLTLLHWIFVHNNLGPALVHFVPLAALELYRVYCAYFPLKQEV
jgi:sulfoxide reductase heme-binding subunit YedZ